MSVQFYWEERLREGAVFYKMNEQVEDFDYKAPVYDGGWPRAIARKSIYANYVKWCTDKGRVPEEEHDFYTAFAPYIYIKGTDEKKRQVKNHKRYETQNCRGRFVRLRVSRYFVRLFPFKDHVAKYSELTGIPIA